MAQQEYDLVIIGAGPAGLTACLYALRSRLKTLMLDKMQMGGYLSYIGSLENYPGFPEAISGKELGERIVKQLEKYGREFRLKEVRKIEAVGEQWRVNAEGEEISAKTVIIATGSRPRGLNIPGEKEFLGKGVSTCAICDAPFFRDKEIFVIGGGNTALEESLYLSEFAAKVNIVHRRDELRADRILQERARANQKISFLLSSECVEILGENVVRAVKIRDKKSGQVSEYQCKGVFLFTGMLPQTDFLSPDINRDAVGYIITDVAMMTSAKGIFAAGDCRQGSLRQVVSACGEGAHAAYSVKRYLENYF